MKAESLEVWKWNYLPLLAQQKLKSLLQPLTYQECKNLALSKLCVLHWALTMLSLWENFLLKGASAALVETLLILDFNSQTKWHRSHLYSSNSVCIFGIIYDVSQSEPLYLFAVKQDCLQNLRKRYFGKCTQEENMGIVQQTRLLHLQVNAVSEGNHVATLFPSS